MVSSGLIENTDVSHYRLALHLSIAFIILSLTYWYLLENLNIKKYHNKINSKFLLTFIDIICADYFRRFFSRFRWRINL